MLATCCGARTFVEIAEVAADLDVDLLDAVGVVRRVPSAATFCRVAAMVDPDQLDRALSS
ncbi:transposase family protein [Oerskovia merdavium]|uniref:Transposase family protein n=1 Tax=Oerskovia merdavium TaxID=2762227 RepID=A0ABR8U3W7_9CELL|nr:transposase family protein [Oerskovia merdavium]MBD7982731.1 transposase family protein [Oerskovia merdavium]